MGRMGSLTCLVLFFLSLISCVAAWWLDDGLKVCYDDVGCFNLAGDFAKRPVQLLPLNPSVIKTKFLLNTRKNPTEHQILSYKDDFSVRSSHFRGNRKTKFIVHGFIDYGTRKWLMDMMKEFLTYEDCNVIRVDWGAGSKIPYTQASANTRVVGAEIALLIERLEEWTGAKPEDMHILGHSLGSHIAGYAGERITAESGGPGLGMITGLDPAEPYFQGYGPAVILDPTDAMFVEAIHTDGESVFNVGNDIIKGDKGFGMIDPVGHIDFYPNNGFQQPGCAKTAVSKIIGGDIVTAMEDIFACSHMRVTKLYTESINSACPFMAYTCSSFTNFKHGHCLTCGVNGMCTRMGPRSKELTPELREKIANGETNIKLYLITGAQQPYCRYNHRVDVGVSYNKGEEVRGDVYIELVGKLGRTGDIKLSREVETFYPGDRHLYLVTTPSPIGNISSVHFWWDYSWSITNPGGWPILKHPKFYLRNVRHNDDQHVISEYCANDAPIDEGKKYKTVLFAAQTANKRCETSGAVTVPPGFLFGSYRVKERATPRLAHLQTRTESQRRKENN